jgi:GAF domain-containing protein
MNHENPNLSTALQCTLLEMLTGDNPPDLETALRPVAERAAEVLNASACTVWVIDHNGSRGIQRAGTGYHARFNGKSCRVVPAHNIPQEPLPREKLGLTGWILSSGRYFLAKTPEELESHLHRTGAHDPARLQGGKLRLQTFLGVPLRDMYGGVVGLIKAERRQLSKAPEKVAAFSIADQIALETIARVASKCVVYLRMIESGKLEEAITAWARDVVAEAVATEGDLDSFLNVVVRVMAAAMHADSCGIYLTDPDKKTLTQRAGVGSQAPHAVNRSYPLYNLDEIEKHRPIGLTAWIAVTGQPAEARNFPELSQHPHHRGQFDEWNFPKDEGTICGAFLGGPLRVGGTVTGVLKVENRSKIGLPDPRHFSRKAQQRFDVLAEDIALDVERLRVQAGARYKVIIEAQKPIAEILRGRLRVPELVKNVVTHTARLLQARSCTLFLREGDQLIQPPWAATGYAERGPRRAYMLVPVEEIMDEPAENDKVGLTVWIAQKRQEFSARSNLELRSHPHHLGTFDKDNFEAGQRCESFMGKPLLLGDDLLGVLKVETKMRLVDGKEEYSYFSDQDSLVFEMIANSAASALENARLHETNTLANNLSSRRNDVLTLLHEYALDSWYSPSTLHRTAEVLRTDLPKLSEIVSHFAFLLEPNFDARHLQTLAGLLRLQGEETYRGSSTLAPLYQTYFDALQAASLGDIRRLCDRRPLNDPELDRRRFLPEVRDVMRKLMDEAAEELAAQPGSAQQLAMYGLLERIRKLVADQGLPQRAIVVRIVEHWQAIVAESIPFQAVDESLYVTGQPIFPGGGSSLFGREVLLDWLEKSVRGAGQRNMIVLFGERRMGKTSLLLEFAEGKFGDRLRDSGIFPVHVDLQQGGDFDSPAAVIRLILKRVAGQVGSRVALPCPPTDAELEREPFVAFNNYMGEIDRTLTQPMVAILLDEFEVLDRSVRRKEFGPGIYDALRHNWQFLKNVSFVIAGSHRSAELSEDYRSLIGSTAQMKRVGYLDEKAAEALVRTPVAGRVFFEDAAVKALVEVTHGHPHYLQLLCKETMFAMNYDWHVNTISLARVEHIIHKAVHEPGLFDAVRPGNGFSHLEYSVLLAVAQAARAHRQPTSPEIAGYLSRVPADPSVGEAIIALVQREWLQRHDQGAHPWYSVTMPMMQQWLILQAP